MRHIPLILLLISIASCTKYIYVPIESKVIEYRDVLKRDSIRLYDSIYVKDKGDTVFIEKYKYLYRDVLKVDSFVRTDTIKVPVFIEKELGFWDNIKIKYSNIVVGILMLIILIFFVRKFFSH